MNITLEKLLAEMRENVPIIKVGDVIETIKTAYPSSNVLKKEKNIIIEGIEMTRPLVCSKQTKKMFIKEKSPLVELFIETSRGDLLKVFKIEKNKVYCENLSIKNSFKQNNIKTSLIIDKVDILRGSFKLVQRGVSKITNLLNIP